MADQNEGSTGMAGPHDDNSQPLFKDPLHVNDPLTSILGTEDDEWEFEIDDIKDGDLPDFGDQTSSLANLALDDELEGETKDLFVVVDNPEKHVTAMESYITFRITVKTTRSEYDTHEFQVRRRYNDFLWLRQRLEETQPTHLVPPLPEKHSLRRLDRFSQEFVKTRQRALQKFLTRIADHPVLSFNHSFQVFLTAKQWEFQAHKKEGAGFMSRMADSIHNMSASYMMKNRSPEFTIMNDYVQTFAEKLATIDRISQRVAKEEIDYLAELNEWGPVFTLWSNSEDKLSGALAAIAKAIEKNYLSKQDMVDATECAFSQPLREYMLYAEAVKTVLRRRDAIQMQYEMTLDELNKKKDEKDQVSISDQTYSFGAFFGKDPEEVKQEKQEKIERQIEELTKQVEVLNDKTVCANADLKADMERWHKNKRRDFRKLFTEVADRQIKYYQKCLAAWEDVIPRIQRTDLAKDTDDLLQGSANS